MQVSVSDPLPPEDWGDHAAEVAIERLYHRESRRLALFFARRVAHDDVVDLVQESFRRLIGVSANSRSWLNNPEAYLQTIAGNLLRESHRPARLTQKIVQVGKAGA